MNEPHIWWYITRASAIIAWVLMTLSVVWGVLLSTRVMRKADDPAWLQDLHRYLGGLTLLMVALHMVSLMLDEWLKFSFADVLVPFNTSYKAFPVALGIVAFYLLFAVQMSSLVMHRLPRKFWKGLHYSSYAALLLVSLHAGLAGKDVGSSWYVMLSVSLIMLSSVAMLVRVLLGAKNKAAAVDEAVPVHSTTAVAAARASTRTMVVASVSKEAAAVVRIRLVPLGGGILPIWPPGAHITLFLPNGLERQYSLCGDPVDRSHFDIAVLRTENSEGGSIWIHENLMPGMTLEVSGPFSHFDLEPAREYLFIAGGIGITPIKAMIESLPASRDWRLVYLGRSRSTMAFVRELEAEYPSRVMVRANDENPIGTELTAIVGRSAAAVYCCGPESLMNSVADLVSADRMHMERFVAVERTSAIEDAAVFVSCAKSKKEFTVPAGESILTALENNGLPVLGSCKKGVCGTCEVSVLAGRPNHLDSVMDDAEKDELHIMYPCVSRASTPTLVLDI